MAPAVDQPAAAGHSPDGCGTAEPGRRLSLSPSRALDFKRCPLLYRLRAIDRIPEPPSAAAARGTAVHAVLEQLFGHPAAERTEQAAVDSVAAVWAELVAAEPTLAAVIEAGQEAGWFAGIGELVRTYFRLENPAGFSPEACELAVELHLPTAADPLPLKGFIDRVDLAPTGELRIVDYKTGRSPSENYEVGALYQLKFYALMLYRLRGVPATELKLLYLADGVSLRYRPDLAELLAFERGVIALWQTISEAVESGNFPPNRSSACRWCEHQARCPEFGGTPPPYPRADSLAR